jgi:DNA-binding transcriptional MerR regulator
MIESEKQYYSISETAEIFGVKTSLLRSWENEFELLKPFKNQKGTRFFTQKDIEIIRTILYLTKEKGYTLQGAKEEIRSNLGKLLTQADVIHKLNTVREFLLEIKNNLQ